MEHKVEIDLSIWNWIIIIQIILIHWKLAYNLPFNWPTVFAPVIAVGTVLVLLTITNTVRYIRAKASRRHP